MRSQLKKPFALLLILLHGAVCQASEAILVVHKDNRLTSITRRTAELIFLGKKTEWTQGEHIHVVVNNDPEVYVSFCRNILLKTPQQYLIYRKKMLFNGSGIPPITMSNDAEVKAFIAATKEPIGFISRESLDSRVKELMVH